MFFFFFFFFCTRFEAKLAGSAGKVLSLEMTVSRLNWRIPLVSFRKVSFLALTTLYVLAGDGGLPGIRLFTATPAAGLTASGATAAAVIAGAPRGDDDDFARDSNAPVRAATPGDDSEIAYSEVNFRDTSFVVSNLHLDWVTRREPHVMASLHDAVQGRAKGAACFVLDVGMNDGFFSVMAAKLGCRVVSFELQEKCIRIARRAFDINGVDHLVRIVHRPASSEEGVTMVLPYDSNYCSGTFGFANRNCGEHCNPNFPTTRAFLSVALGERFGGSGAAEIDWLKVDVEGLDPSVLAGALPLFRRRLVRIAMVEIDSGTWLAAVRANTTQDNWVVFEIMSFGYLLQCLTSPNRFTSTSPRAEVLRFIYSGSCIDYELKRAQK